MIPTIIPIITIICGLLMMLLNLYRYFYAVNSEDEFFGKANGVLVVVALLTIFISVILTIYC